MIRVVDATRFMQHYPWGDIQEPLYIRIEDALCSWNDRLY